MSITTCVIPAAGFGTRFLPATKAQPKEMLPIVDTPVIQYLVEEAVASGITDIVIVTGRGKRSIEDHFDHSFELSHTLVEKGKTAELALVERVSTLANIAYVRQPIPRGDGDAILRARQFVGESPFLVLFGDDLVRGAVPAAKQIINAYERTLGCVVATEAIPDAKVHSYGIVETQGSGTLARVLRLLEKPKSTETASRRGVIGKYVVTPEIFDALESCGRSEGGELRLADALALLVKKEQNVHALTIEGRRYDTGDKLGFLKATVDFALEREDLGEEFREFLCRRIAE